MEKSKSLIKVEASGGKVSIEMQGDTDMLVYLIGESILSLSEDSGICHHLILRNLSDGISRCIQERSKVKEDK